MARVGFFAVPERNGSRFDGKTGWARQIGLQKFKLRRKPARALSKTKPEHECIDRVPGAAIVARAPADRDKTVGRVECGGGGIVLGHLQKQCVTAALPRRRDERSHEGPPDAAPAALGSDAEREHFADLARGEGQAKTDRSRLLPGKQTKTAGHRKDLAARGRVPRIVGKAQAVQLRQRQGSAGRQRFETATHGLTRPERVTGFGEEVLGGCR